MGTPRLPLETAQEAVTRVETCLREGFRPKGVSGIGRAAVKEAAVRSVADGWCNTTSGFETRLRIAEDLYNLVPDESLYRAKQYQHRTPGLPVMVDNSFVVEDDPEGEPELIGIIGDAHDSPHLKDKSRFEWIGKHFADAGVDRIVSVGDFMTMDCFSTHTDRATFEGMSKPTFAQDMESMHSAQRALQNGLGSHKVKKLITFGNHEHRAWRYDNAHPDGLSHSEQVVQGFMQWGWKTANYGEWRFIQGVGFTHVPFNGLGRPLAQGQRANKAMVDTIHGDDHRHLTMTDHKSGPFRSPTVYSAATALPPGHIEGYANKGGSTWRSGAVIATVWGGHVRSWQFTEMILLRKRYG